VGEGHLFVYGTLRPGWAPAALAKALAGARSLGPARVAGRLYDLGPHPGARLDGEPGDEIAGEVLALPELEARLADLDRYEGYRPEAPEASLYLRTRCDARLASGETIRCFVYVIAAEPPAARRIADGRWRR